MCFLRSDSNRLEVVLVSFVAMEKRRFMVETALQLEDIVNRFDIVEIIVVRTQKGKQEGGALAGLSEEYVRLLHHTLPLNFGPTGNGEEDGKTVSVTTLSANTPTESTDACIKRHLEPYHLDAVYERLSGGESGDGSIKRETPDGALRLDLPGSTLRALDVFHSGGKAKGSLLSMLDRCITVCGSRCLRKWLAAPSAETAVVTARQEAVSFLLHGKDGGVVEELLQECAKVGDVESTIGKLYAKRCGVLEYLRLLRMVRNTRLLASQIEKESLPSLLADSVGNLHCSGISSFLETHKAEIESTATNPLELFMAEGMTQPAQFVSLSASRDNALKALDKELDRIREVLKLPALEYKTISGTPFVIDVPVGKSNKAEKDWTVLSRTKTNVRYHTPDILQHNISLCAARERLFVAATEAWDDYQVRLSGDHHTKSALDRLIQSVASLDVLRSLSMVSRQPGYVCPNLVPYGNTERVALKKARHPVMEHLIPGGYVGCDVEITVGGAWLLTGPNMGGKSALMRMVALCVIMAHLGCYVPADSACIPIFTGVYCRMGASDSILDGSSTFLSEMSETSRILGSPHLSRSLVLMDELGRGTSSFDGAAVAASTLEFLLQSGATTIFVTHYNYICEPYQDSRVQSVECYYMGFEVRTGDGNKRQLVFTYQPCKGITPSSFGVDVARQAGLPLSVTEAAKELSSKMEKELNFIVDGSKVRRFLQE
ncbi:DNA mismatch repair protein MSH3 [Angomonas deanei]|uniref:MutS domain III/MutS family domain IV/MutS domain V, putative n=1 Tax=Angomonas deanei TaxID=59799 RepID=A0A7G2CR60_9TRYP|nr:DNA mismatch repair protein MSH3 [Angomonas deanei]CAD2221975.1 MutS domain III/MutS family domain IV/MutS domain V, putative [Angomonas deanei]|eukprot:EPY35418.1 DNA mismatch repair protein MSH3 [Angomonas deanei]